MGGRVEERERKVLGKVSSGRKATHHARGLAIDRSGQSLGCHQEILMDVLLICRDDVCIIPYSCLHKLYNNMYHSLMSD